MRKKIRHSRVSAELIIAENYPAPVLGESKISKNIALKVWNALVVKKS